MTEPEILDTPTDPNEDVTPAPDDELGEPDATADTEDTAA